MTPHNHSNHRDIAKRQKNARLARALALSLGTTLVGFSPLGSQTAQAAAQTWDGGGAAGNWDDPLNWTNDALPWTGTPGNATINTAVGNFPVIVANPSGTPVDIIIGATTAGRLDQRGGTLATGTGNWLIVGRGAGGVGTYNLADTSSSGGTLTGFGVGSGSTNVGGSSTTGGRLLVGDGSTSIGTVNVNTSGTLKMEEDAIGVLLGNGGTSTGNFNLDGGTVTINSATATGIAILAGTNGGDGTFRMSGGSVNAVGGVWAGDNNVGSQGLYEITGGTFTATGTGSFTGNQAGQHYIGRGLGQGTFNVSGTANVTLNGITHLGFSNTATAGTTGILAVSGGTLTTGGEVRVGSGSQGNSVIAAGTGTFNVSGGTATVASLTAARGNDNTDLVTGTVNVTDGVLTSIGNLTLGFAGNNNLGRLNVAGGTVNVGTTTAATLAISVFDTSRGQLDVSSGNLRLNTNSSIRFTTGNTGTNSTNVVNQTGGAVTFYSDNGVTVGGTGFLDLQQSGAATVNNTYNLDGGTLTVPRVTSTLATGTRTFNFNGGTLKPTEATTTFMTLGAGNARANVRNNGALIDSNGFNITIGQALVHSNVGGDNAIDGGLTKSGLGMLTLTGVNTYTGPTNVNAGTLGFSTNANSLAALTVADGAGLNVKTAAAGSTLLTTTSLTLGTAGATSLTFDFSSLNPTVAQISTSSLTLNGTVSVGLAATGGLTTNTYKLIDYSTLGGSFSALTPGSFTFGHSSATLVNNTVDTSVDLNVVVDNLVWSGAGTSTWATAATGDSTGPNDWATKNGLAATNFWANDAVEFNDTYNVGAGDVAVASRSVNIAGANVVPASVTFNNSTGDYTIASAGGFGIAGPGGLTKNGTSKTTLTTVNTYAGATTINAGTLELGNGTAGNDGTISATSGVTNNGTLIFNRFGASSASYSISGAGNVVKNGPGTQTLSGANSYAGGTTVNAGVVSIGANNNLGANAAPVTLDGGTLRTTAGITNTHPFTIGAGGGTINVTTTGQYFFNTANTLLGNGPLTLTGNGTLTVNLGNLRVAQTNTYSGAITTTSGGIFEYGVLNAVAPAATFTIANEGEVALQGGSATTMPNTITVTGGTNSVLSFENGTLGNYGGPITLNASAIVGLRDWYNHATVRSGTISGEVTGVGGLTVNSGTGNGGLLTLSNAANSYAGGTTINASRVLASATGALGTGGVTVGGTNAQIQLGAGVNLANALIINAGAGTVAQGVVWVPTAAANATYSGPITINAIQGSGGHFAANGGVLTVAGAVTSSVPVTTRLGTVVFTNTGSSYTDLQVQQGTVQVGATNAIPTGTTIDLGASGAATLDLGGFNQTLAGLTKNTNAATVTNSGAIDATLTTTGTSTFAGVIQDGSTNTTALTVASGSLTLAGTNTYTGATNVNGGSLIVTGSLAGTSAINVASGAILAGNGTLNSAATLSIAAGGNLAPGLSPGILTTGSVAFASGADFTLELNGATLGALYDNLNVIGNVSLGGADLFVNLGPGFAPIVGQTFTVISNDLDDLIAGSFATINGGAFGAGNTFSLTNDQGTYAFAVHYSGEGSSVIGGNDVVVEVVPEPGVAVSLLGGIGMLLGMRRRRSISPKTVSI